MPRYILTGAPGAGKTALLRALELRGCFVVEEAATDVIALRRAEGCAEPWVEPGFIDAVVGLQRRRQSQRSNAHTDVQMFDRSPVCTLALRRFLDRRPSPTLLAELERIERERTYERQVLFVRNLGFCQSTAARRISFDDSLRFEAVHAEAYQELGYELADVPAGPLEHRVRRVLAMLAPASDLARRS